MDDRELLRQYVETHSESAFTELVRRHLDLVYATALRLVCESHSAEDVAQAVFIRLARNARTIREGNALPGWLYRATCGMAKDHIRGERRRRERENESMTHTQVESQSSQAAWESMAPFIEEAIRQLNTGEQNAVVLRFFEAKGLGEVGRALGISEDAAQKRVSRALEKLRSYLGRRGVIVSAAVLAGTLMVPSGYAAPAALSGTVGANALAAGPPAAGGLAGLTAGQLKGVVASVFLLAAGIFLVSLFTRQGSGSTLASTSRFRGLGDLPGGQFISYASAVSGDGRVVVGGSQSVNGNEAFRWTDEGGMVALGDLAGGIFSSSANGVSADGAVIVGSSSSASGPQAFRWTGRLGMAGIGDLAGGRFSSVAYGISGDGRIIVGESSSARGQRESFRWENLEMSGLGALFLQRLNSQAMAASEDGSVVVGISARADLQFEAFRWTAAGGMMGLGDFPGGVTNSNAFAVSPDGRFVVGYGCPGTFDPFTHEAFRWSEQAGLEHLGFAPGLRNSAAYAVSADGNVIVGDNKSETPAVALIWDPKHGMRRLQEVLVKDYGLDLAGWQLTSARGISHDGRTIVGSGVNPAGQIEGWAATLTLPPYKRGKL